MIRNVVRNVVRDFIFDVTSYAGGAFEWIFAPKSTSDLESIADLTSTRNSTWMVPDYLGVYNEIPINVTPFKGARWTGTEFMSTEADGTTPIDPDTICIPFFPPFSNSFGSAEYRVFSGGSWSTSCNVTEDQTGIDGTLNSAALLEDDNASAREDTNRIFTVADDSTWHSYSLFIKKDSTTSRYPAIEFYLSLGTTAKRERIIVNTQTGTCFEESSEGEYVCLSVGDWWFITLTIQNNTTGNTRAHFYISPAGSINGTQLSNTATGSIIADWAQFGDGIKYCPPNPVKGGESLAAQVMYVEETDIINDSEGSVFLVTEMQPEDKNIISNCRMVNNGNDGRIIYLYGVDNNLGSNYDGTNLNQRINSIVGLTKYVTYWGYTKDKSQITSNGASSGLALYDGTWDSGNLYIGSADGTGGYYNGDIYKIIITHDAKDQAYWENLTN